MRALLQQKCRPLALVQVRNRLWPEDGWKKKKTRDGRKIEQRHQQSKQVNRRRKTHMSTHHIHVAGKGTMAVDDHRCRRSDDGISNFLLVHFLLVLVIHQPSHNDPRLHLGPGNRGAARSLPYPKKRHYGCLRRAFATGVAQGEQQRRASEGTTQPLEFCGLSRGT